jgi:ElaB/YqjD/DUF883 family membrane-anchored ribosome-binding protein
MADPEVIQAQMDETRHRLAENLDKLTRQTADTVQEVASSVSNTVESVQESVEAVTDAVQGSVEAVTETVHETVGGMKNLFDIAGHVDRNPWLMVGGAAALGFFACRMLTPPSPSREALPPSPSLPPPTPAPAKAPEMSLETSPGARRLEGHWPEEHTHEQSEPKGFLEGLTESYGPLLDKLKSFAIGAAMGVARNVIAPNGAAGIASDIRGMIDNFTKQMGGEPIADVPQANKDQKDNNGSNKNLQRDNGARERIKA